MNLVHGRPNVIEELNLHYRLHAPNSVADSPAHDIGLTERRIKDALRAELGLQARGELEDSALALDLDKNLLAAGVGNIFAIDHNARIATHLVVQAGVDQVGHGALAALLSISCHPSACLASLHLLRCEYPAGGIQILGVDVPGDFLHCGKRSLHGVFGGLGGLVVRLLLQIVDLVFGQNFLA